MWIQVDIIFALYECENVNSHSDCFIPGKVFFDSCAMVGVLVWRSFSKDGGKNTSFFCCESVAMCIASKLFTILTVGYCVLHKNQYSTYCVVMSDVLAVELQWCLQKFINSPGQITFIWNALQLIEVCLFRSYNLKYMIFVFFGVTAPNMSGYLHSWGF